MRPFTLRKAGRNTLLPPIRKRGRMPARFHLRQQGCSWVNRITVYELAYDGKMNRSLQQVVRSGRDAVITGMPAR